MEPVRHFHCNLVHSRDYTRRNEDKCHPDKPNHYPSYESAEDSQRYTNITSNIRSIFFLIIIIIFITSMYNYDLQYAVLIICKQLEDMQNENCKKIF